ncbi:MAG TPA: hypothetical protein DCQ30_13310 [Acidimicrobiaceae bacterium]|nr:hypothetical protein [Acidimicrobiaceae bacterium]
MGAARPARQRDVALTVLSVVLVPGFLAMGWWQLTRALSGNTLSWAYVFEWPLFAGYLIYIRWRLAREDRPGVAHPEDAAGESTGAAARSAGNDDQEDEELAAYNRYLAALEESGRRKRW